MSTPAHRSINTVPILTPIDAADAVPSGGREGKSLSRVL